MGNNEEIIIGVRLATLSITVVCLGILIPADAAQHGKRRTEKPEPPGIASELTGPLPPVSLDLLPAEPPLVNYQKGQLTIVAVNSTMADILHAVQNQTGADVEFPDANERVVTHLGPGPARDVMAELLAGSRFDYVLLGSAADPSGLTRVVLVEKAGESAGRDQDQSAARPETSLAKAAPAPPGGLKSQPSASPALPTPQPVSTPTQVQTEEPHGMLESPD